MDNFPWIIAGDFNARLTTEDCIGGASSGVNPCNLFCQWFQASSLVNLGFQGPQFTWSKNGLKVRLDIAFRNLKWLDMFP